MTLNLVRKEVNTGAVMNSAEKRRYLFNKNFLQSKKQIIAERYVFVKLSLKLVLLFSCIKCYLKITADKYIVH